MEVAVEASTTPVAVNLTAAAEEVTTASRAAAAVAAGRLSLHDNPT